jgi:DNA sulfur modification protein DndC
LSSTDANLFGSRKQTVDEALELTALSLNAYADRHPHWCVAWSGGKDSTATLTVLLHLLDSGAVKRPERLTVMYADTRMELLPLWVAAADIREQLAARGVEVRTVMAPMDKRFLVYMLGRGVPPPNNGTLHWCTRQIKIDPMIAELRGLLDGAQGPPALMLTGVRLGESAARDGRIAMSCSKDGAECGQGWYQEALPEGLTATLAPLLHWRVCNVWDWLKFYAPARSYGGWKTALLAEAYSTDEASEHQARTGCVGCPLATRDLALDLLTKRAPWAYLQPLHRLRPLWRELRLAPRRLRQPGGEKRKDGTLATNQQRLGPLTLETRLWALEEVRAIQAAVNAAARAEGRPEIDLLNAEEEARIRELIAAKTWPHGWTGDEPTGDVLLDAHNEDGSVQPLLTGLFGG